MKIVTKADKGQWIRATNDYERIIATASTKAMRETGKAAVTAGRSAMANAGFGSTWQKALVASPFRPPTGVALNPSVWVHSRINYADIFETGKTITANTFIWLPLPSVPPWPATGRPIMFGGVVARPHMTPKQYIAKVGPLIKVNRPGKPPLLGAVIKRGPKAQPFGRFATRTQLKRGKTGRGEEEFIPLYVGVPSVNIPKKYDVTGAIEAAAKDLAKFYLENLEKYEGR